MIERAKEKIRKQAEEAKHPLSQMLSMQIIDNITTISRAEKVLNESKNLDQCQKALDKFADGKKQGNKSFVSPLDAEKVIFDYFEFEKEEPKSDLAKAFPILDVNVDDFI